MADESQVGSTSGSSEPLIIVDSNSGNKPIEMINADASINIMEKEYDLPSGGRAKVEKFCGVHVIEALTDTDKGEDRTEDAMLWQLVCATCSIDGVKISTSDIDEMDGRDVDFLMAKFSAAIEGKEAKPLPDGMPEPPKDCRWKLLPDGSFALIEKYKGRHIKEAQRQMNPDGSNYLSVLMSRMMKIGPTPETVKGLFPEDLFSIDGLAFLSLLGEVAEAMFPAGKSH